MLALSYETPAEVGPYVDQHGLGVRVAAQGGRETNEAYAVSGFPSSVLIDPQGNVAWTGHPSSLTASTVKSALKGAKAPGGGFLSLRVDRELAKKLSSAVDDALEGALGKALASAQKAAADERVGETERADAQWLADEILGFGTLLLGQADAYLARREVLSALEVFRALEDELAGTDVGKTAAERLATIADDDSIQTEIEAAEAFAKAQDYAKRRGRDKAGKKFEAIVEKYPGTRAAERAKTILASIDE